MTAIDFTRTINCSEAEIKTVLPDSIKKIEDEINKQINMRTVEILRNGVFGSMQGNGRNISDELKNDPVIIRLRMTLVALYKIHGNPVATIKK